MKERGIMGNILIAASQGRKTQGRSRTQGFEPLPLRLGAFQGKRNTRVFERQVTLSPILKEKDPLLALRALWIREPFDEECPPLVIEPDIAVDGLRHPHPDSQAASSSRKSVDHFLRERLEEHRPRARTGSHDRVHRLCPRPPVLLLALDPVVNEQMQGAELIPCLLLVLPEGCLRLVARQHRRPSPFLVIALAHRPPLR